MKKLVSITILALSIGGMAWYHRMVHRVVERSIK